ncbi:type III polyketide synthase [Actinomadura sp. 1N219]|uniref:type III polyketide synthase n=1 Tax=Actinomadura sp. 1N219 TaxID=3375152 RepID=UPI00378C4008
MTARIVNVSFVSPPAVKMDEFAALFAADPGGDEIARVIGNSAIDAKGMAVNPFAEDPRGWSTRTRMDRSLAEAVALGREAVDLALRRAGVAASEVGLLVTSTTTTHSVPGLDALTHELGMSRRTQALSLGPMGCYAALPSLLACRDWVEVHKRPAVLLLVDLFSPHLQPPPYDKEKAVVLTLFGDGAAAVVFRPDAPTGQVAAGPGLEIVDAETLVAPEHAADLQVHLGEHGMDVRLAPTMPDVVANAVPGLVGPLLARHGLRHDDIAWWALHPGGRRILDRVEENLRLPETSVRESRAVMRSYGNTAGPAVMAVLEQLWRSAPVAAGEHVMALAFGPGATLWALLLCGTRTDPTERKP